MLNMVFHEQCDLLIAVTEYGSEIAMALVSERVSQWYHHKNEAYSIGILMGEEIGTALQQSQNTKVESPPTSLPS